METGEAEDDFDASQEIELAPFDYDSNCSEFTDSDSSNPDNSFDSDHWPFEMLHSSHTIEW